MLTLGIVLVVLGGLGLVLAGLGKALMGWPGAGKAAGLAAGLAVVGAILWVAAPPKSDPDTPAPETVQPDRGAAAPKLNQPLPRRPPPAPCPTRTPASAE